MYVFLTKRWLLAVLTSFSRPAVSQNNWCANEVYFRVAYSANLHFITVSVKCYERTKFAWVNFKALISFIQQFMNQTASSLADRRKLWRVGQVKICYRQKEGRTLELWLGIGDRGQNVPSQTVPLWHGDCFEVKAVETQKTQEKLFTLPLTACTNFHRGLYQEEIYYQRNFSYQKDWTTYYSLPNICPAHIPVTCLPPLGRPRPLTPLLSLNCLTASQSSVFVGLP